MKTCPYCNTALEDTTRFCHMCGKEQPVEQPPATYAAQTVNQETPSPYTQPPVTPAAPTYEASTYQAPTYSPSAYQQPAETPVYQQPPYPQPPYAQPAAQTDYAVPTPPAAPSKAKSIVGMALGIGSLVMGVTGLLCTILFTAVAASGLDVEETSIFGITYGFMFMFFSLPLAIIALVMSQKSITAGNTTKISRLGKIFGIVGLVLSAVLCILACVNIGILADDSYSAYDSYYDDYDDYDYDDYYDEYDDLFDFYY